MEFKFDSNDFKTKFMTKLRAENPKLGSQHVVCESMKKSKRLDYFLEVIPTIYPTENGTEKRSVVCLSCYVENKPNKLLVYSSSGCLV